MISVSSKRFVAFGGVSKLTLKLTCLERCAPFTVVEPDCFLVETKSWSCLPKVETAHYNIKLESQMLGCLLMFFSKTCVFLEKVPDNEAERDPKMTMDYRNRLKHMETNLRFGAFSIEDAQRHVFFYNPRQVLDIITCFVNDTRKAIRELEQNKDNDPDYKWKISQIYKKINTYNNHESAIGANWRCWDTLLCPVMEEDVKRSNDANTIGKQSIETAKSAIDAIDNQSVDTAPTQFTNVTTETAGYRTDRFFDLLRYIRNKYNHPETINDFQKPLIGDGKDIELYMNYWTRHFPVLVLVVWELAMKTDRFPLDLHKVNKPDCMHRADPYERYEPSVQPAAAAAAGAAP